VVPAVLLVRGLSELGSLVEEVKVLAILNHRAGHSSLSLLREESNDGGNDEGADDGGTHGGGVSVVEQWMFVLCGVNTRRWKRASDEEACVAGGAKEVQREG